MRYRVRVPFLVPLRSPENVVAVFSLRAYEAEATVTTEEAFVEVITFCSEGRQAPPEALPGARVARRWVEAFPLRLLCLQERILLDYVRTLLGGAPGNEAVLKAALAGGASLIYIGTTAAIPLVVLPPTEALEAVVLAGCGEGVSLPRGREAPLTTLLRLVALVASPWSGRFSEVAEELLEKVSHDVTEAYGLAEAYPIVPTEEENVYFTLVPSEGHATTSRLSSLRASVIRLAKNCRLAVFSEISEGVRVEAYSP